MAEEPSYQRKGDQKEYGRFTSPASADMKIMFFLGSHHKDSPFKKFEKSIDMIHGTSQVSSQIGGNNRFRKAYADLTSWGSHQWGNHGIFHNYASKNSESPINFQKTAWMMLPLNEFPNIECTLRATTYTLPESSKNERFWEYKLGFNYNGNDEKFEPERVEPRTWRDKLLRENIDSRSMKEKMPLLSQTYGASITLKGGQKSLNPDHAYDGKPVLEIIDPQLECIKELEGIEKLLKTGFYGKIRDPQLGSIGAFRSIEGLLEARVHKEEIKSQGRNNREWLGAASSIKFTYL